MSVDQASDEIILHPSPSSDPNDPLVSLSTVLDILFNALLTGDKNWSRRRKYLNFAFVSLYTTLIYALVNVQTVQWGVLNTQLGFSYGILDDSYAAGTASLMVGGVILIPFALKFGRRFVYTFSLAIQCGMAIWYGRTMNVGDLMGSNTVSCVVGALSEIMVQMTVADIFFVHERGLMNSIYYWIANLGSSLAGIPAGYITASSIGWRWVWYILAILQGVLTVLFFFFYEETQYQRGGALVADGEVKNTINSSIEQRPTDFQHSEKEAQGYLETQTNETATSPQVQTRFHHYVDYSIPEKPYREKIKPWISAPGSFWHYCKHSYQCFIVMWHIPSVLYMAVLNGASNTAQIICITVYSDYLLDAPYNFSEADIGLMGLAGFIGTALCAPFIGRLSDRMIIWMAKRNNGIYEPEMRLWLILLSAPFFVLGLLLFGLGIAHKQPWPVVAVGFGIVYFATTPAGSLSLTYLTDSYTEIIADCLVGLVVVKFGFATILVFALTPWIKLDGLQNMFIIITMVFLALYGGNYVLIRYGKKLRQRAAPKYFELAERQVMSVT